MQEKFYWSDAFSSTNPKHEVLAPDNKEDALLESVAYQLRSRNGTAVRYRVQDLIFGEVAEKAVRKTTGLFDDEINWLSLKISRGEYPIQRHFKNYGLRTFCSLSEIVDFVVNICEQRKIQRAQGRRGETLASD